MNRPSRTLYLLVIAIAIAGCGRARGHVDHHGSATITRNWPAASVRQVEVFEVSGNITVEAAETDQITLIAKASGDLDVEAGAENQGLFETTLEGDTLRIGRRKNHGRKFEIPIIFGRNPIEIDYVLHVPPSVSLEVRTVNGRIATRGIAGETEATSVNGSIEIVATGTSELRATTVNGRVRARFLESFQGARFKTVNGGVEATLPESASFSVDLSQVNGDFEAAFPLSIHSNPGSRRVSGEVNGGEHVLKIVTVNGDVELARLNDSL